MVKKRTYKRVCKRCNEIFISETRHRNICDKCKKPNWIKNENISKSS